MRRIKGVMFNRLETSSTDSCVQDSYVYSTLDSKKDEKEEEVMEVYEKDGDEDGGVEDEDDCRRDGGGEGR